MLTGMVMIGLAVIYIILVNKILHTLITLTFNHGTIMHLMLLIVDTALFMIIVGHLVTVLHIFYIISQTLQ